MEGILNFVSIIIIVFGVLQIILFFKMWGMTNNVSKISQTLDLISKNNSQNNKQNHVLNSQNLKPKNDLKIEDLVIELKNNRQLKVVNITDDGRYECIVVGGIRPIGIFDRNEIRPFNNK